MGLACWSWQYVYIKYKQKPDECVRLFVPVHVCVVTNGSSFCVLQITNGLSILAQNMKPFVTHGVFLARV